MRSHGMTWPYEDADAGSLIPLGATAGIVGTMFMTAAMRRLHGRLPSNERYPLPPREITQTVVPVLGESGQRDLSLAAHFGYGAAAGALLSWLRPSITTTQGAGAGILIWLASYLGWAPAGRILRPATHHPMRRNALMLGVHLIWGMATALAQKELRLAQGTILADGPMKDRARGH